MVHFDREQARFSVCRQEQFNLALTVRAHHETATLISQAILVPALHQACLHKARHLATFLDKSMPLPPARASERYHKLFRHCGHTRQLHIEHLNSLSMTDTCKARLSRYCPSPPGWIRL